MRKKIELLSPAGNLEKLEIVLHYGADAAYLGGELFNLRALADNFSNSELEKAVDYAHSLGKKVYVTLNIIPHNEELEHMPKYVKYLEQIGVDGVIVADLGTFALVRENSNLNINVSTQASNTNWRSVKTWKDMGAKRVILARELALNEIKQIRDKVNDIELEVFVHGAMCMSISGRCLLSNYLTGRDANRGACAHPCRWKYSLMEEKREGEYFPVFEDERGTYIFNSKDLCTIEYIDKIIETGVDSLKIEGRMKGIYYAAMTTQIYKKAIDSYHSGNYKFEQKWLDELSTTSNRGFTTGFYLGKTNEESQNYNTNSSYSQTHQLVAKVIEVLGNNEYKLEIRNRLYENEEVEIVKADGNILKSRMPKFFNEKTEKLEEVVHPNTIARVKMDVKLDRLDLIRARK